MGSGDVASVGMVRLRLVAAALMVLGMQALAPASAFANHCPPIDNPDPIPGQNTDYCHTPTPTEKPDRTPKPSPTVDSGATATPAPRTASPQRTFAPAPRTTANTPEPTAFDIEVPEEDALATPQILVEGPLDDPSTFEVDAETTGSISNWIFGFVLGLIVGLFVGRASWGIKRRRRQQIFG